VDWLPPVPPGNVDEYQTKGFTNFAIRNRLILKDLENGCCARESQVENRTVGVKIQELPPHPCFLVKSAESIENKRVEFFVGAKKVQNNAEECARV
jgi:hypothetical protein